MIEKWTEDGGNISNFITDSSLNEIINF